MFGWYVALAFYLLGMVEVRFARREDEAEWHVKLIAMLLWPVILLYAVLSE